MQPAKLMGLIPGFGRICVGLCGVDVGLRVISTRQQHNTIGDIHPEAQRVQVPNI